jgi:hypothetical protein
MLVPIDQMPDTSRLWIYQAERKLSQNEIDIINESTSIFLKEWTAHGSDLRASFDILYDQFLIISLDEDLSEASGCSIDASVHHIMRIENELNISLINNGKVAFLVDDQIELMPVNGLKDQVAAKVIQPETKVFNNTVQNLGDFKSKWLIESSETWVNRFFN